MKIEAPDKNLANCFNRLSVADRAAFMAAVVIGFLTHVYAMTHTFLNYDSMWNIYSDQNMISSGRQFLTYACGLSSFYALPWVNGVLSILFLALTAVTVCKAFQIKTKTGAILTAAILVTFPTIAATFGYMFTADGYMIALFLAALSFYLCDKYKWGFIGSIFLLGFSIGIYQAYLSFTIVMCILRLLLSVLEEEWKIIGKRCLRYAAMGVGGYAFYVITLKITLAVEGISMSGYQGTDRVGKMQFSVILSGIPAAYRATKMFLEQTKVLKVNYVMKGALVGCILLAVSYYVILFIKQKRYKSVMRILAAMILVLLLPLGLSTVAVISPDVLFHLLLRMPWALLFIFPVALADRLKPERFLKLSRLMRYATIFCVGVMAFEFAIWSNVAYFNLNERYEKTYAYTLRLVDRLEQTEGYQTGMPVAILGGFPSPNTYPSTDITSEDLKGYFGISGDYCVDSTQKIAAFAANYLNVTIVTVPLEQEIELPMSDAYQEMNQFPFEDCIRQIDGVWVIKLQ